VSECQWCGSRMRMQYPGNDPENGPAEMSCSTGCPFPSEIEEHVRHVIECQAHTVMYPSGCSCHKDDAMDPNFCECFKLSQMTIKELKETIATEKRLDAAMKEKDRQGEADRKAKRW